ncbi:hypothetical protein P3T36_006595 [Kitasatospora sp. MAP12-15]|nr:hypothetical protein [Kitasatospora sp. MAP12-44]
MLAELGLSAAEQVEPLLLAPAPEGPAGLRAGVSSTATTSSMARRRCGVGGESIAELTVPFGAVRRATRAPGVMLVARWIWAGRMRRPRCPIVTSAARTGSAGLPWSTPRDEPNGRGREVAGLPRRALPEAIGRARAAGATARAGRLSTRPTDRQGNAAPPAGRRPEPAPRQNDWMSREWPDVAAGAAGNQCHAAKPGRTLAMEAGEAAEAGAGTAGATAGAAAGTGGDRGLGSCPTTVVSAPTRPGCHRQRASGGMSAGSPVLVDEACDGLATFDPGTDPAERYACLSKTAGTERPGSL